MSELLNMTAIPETFANILNIPTQTAGIMVSLFIVAAIVIFMSIIKAKEIAIAGVIPVTLAFLTFIGWFDVWITMLVALLVSVLFGKEAAKIVRSGS